MYDEELNELKKKVDIAIAPKTKNYVRGYKQGRADAIDECKQILKTQHMIRISEDDFDAKVEVPFYKKLWHKFEQLKENNNG